MPDITGRLSVPDLAAAPSSPRVGEIYFDTVDKRWYVYNGAVWIPAVTGQEDIANRFTVFNDMENQPGTSGPGFNRLTNGTGAAVGNQVIDVGNRQGLQRMTTGSTNSGSAHLLLGINTTSLANLLALGQGRALFKTALRLNALSSAADIYVLNVGFFDTLAAANKVNGAYILYDLNGPVTTGASASANWQAAAAKASTRTITASNLAVATGSYLAFEVDVNAAASSVAFRINGTALSNSPIATANIPNALANALGCGIMLLKAGGSTGTTPVTVDVDYMSLDIQLTTPRT